MIKQIMVCLCFSKHIPGVDPERGAVLRTWASRVKQAARAPTAVDNPAFTDDSPAASGAIDVDTAVVGGEEDLEADGSPATGDGNGDEQEALGGSESSRAPLAGGGDASPALGGGQEATCEAGSAPGAVSSDETAPVLVAAASDETTPAVTAAEAGQAKGGDAVDGVTDVDVHSEPAHVTTSATEAAENPPDERDIEPAADYETAAAVSPQSSLCNGNDDRGAAEVIPDDADSEDVRAQINNENSAAAFVNGTNASSAPFAKRHHAASLSNISNASLLAVIEMDGLSSGVSSDVDLSEVNVNNNFGNDSPPMRYRPVRSYSESDDDMNFAPLSLHLSMGDLIELYSVSDADYQSDSAQY